MQAPLNKPHRPPIWVILVTVAWLALVTAAVWWRWDSFAEMGLNELGDFAAGAAAPLAFFWLIAGYFQQGTELRQNTDALMLQYEALQQQIVEVRNSVQAQNELAHQAKLQVELARKDAADRRVANLGVFLPNFTVSYIGATSYRQPAFRMAFEFILSNSGHDVSSLSFVLTKSCSLEAFLLFGGDREQFDHVMRAGGSERISIVVSADSIGPNEIVISYLDGRGKPRTQHLVATIQPNNKMTFDLSEVTVDE